MSWKKITAMEFMDFLPAYAVWAGGSLALQGGAAALVKHLNQRDKKKAEEAAAAAGTPTPVAEETSATTPPNPGAGTPQIPRPLVKTMSWNQISEERTEQ